TFVAAAGNPNIVGELKRGKKFCDQTYEVHLDGYDQTGLITGKGPSKRQEGTLQRPCLQRPDRRLQVPFADQRWCAPTRYLSRDSVGASCCNCSRPVVARL